MNTSSEPRILRNFQDKLFQALSGVVRLYKLELVKGEEEKSHTDVIIYIQYLKSFETVLSLKFLFMGSDTLSIKPIKSIIRDEIPEFRFDYGNDKDIQMFLDKIRDLLDSHFYESTLTSKLQTFETERKNRGFSHSESASKF